MITLEKMLEKLLETPGVESAGGILYRLADTHLTPADVVVPMFDSPWQRFLTDQDNCEVGVWVNRDERMILSTNRRNWALTICGDDQRYNRAIHELSRFYGRSEVGRAIRADGQLQVYFQDRSLFLIPEPPRGKSKTKA